MSNNDAQSFSFNASAQATAYATWIAPMFVPWIKCLVDICPPSPGDQLLDVATGTGDLAYALAARIGGNGRILGTDFSSSMLENAREKANDPKNKGLSECIEWREGDASSMELPEANFTSAFCHQGLQFVPDPVAACRIVAKSLQPGGSFVAGVWTPETAESNPVFHSVQKGLKAVGKGDWANRMKKPFGWAQSEEEGVTRMKACVEEAGFVEAEVYVKEIMAQFERAEQIYMIGTSSPFGSELAADQALFESYKENVVRELQPFTDPATGNISIPMRSVIVHAKAR